jgi:formate hydrogenlyase subunit 6/NADH:ubiquinone oxidoreductase subunit I
MDEGKTDDLLLAGVQAYINKASRFRPIRLYQAGETRTNVVLGWDCVACAWCESCCLGDAISLK